MQQDIILISGSSSDAVAFGGYTLRPSLTNSPLAREEGGGTDKRRATLLLGTETQAT